MLLRDYIHNLFQGHMASHDDPLKVDIVNDETGEIYFSGSITWTCNDFISDKLVLVKHDGNTIWFKEVK